VIRAVWNDMSSSLSIEGHSEDELVCASVSVLPSTLFAYYEVDEPKSGGFRWKFNMEELSNVYVVEFICRVLKTLQTKYPTEVSFREVA